LRLCQTRYRAICVPPPEVLNMHPLRSSCLDLCVGKKIHVLQPVCNRFERSDARIGLGIIRRIYGKAHAGFRTPQFYRIFKIPLECSALGNGCSLIGKHPSRATYALLRRALLRLACAYRKSMRVRPNRAKSLSPKTVYPCCVI